MDGLVVNLLKLYIIIYTFNFKTTAVLIGASYISIQRYRMREIKWKTRETLASGVYGGYTSLHNKGKEKTELQKTLKDCINLLTL